LRDVSQPEVALRDASHASRSEFYEAYNCIVLYCIEIFKVA